MNALSLFRVADGISRQACDAAGGRGRGLAPAAHVLAGHRLQGLVRASLRHHLHHWYV